MTDVYDTMAGLGRCIKEQLCDYHRAKVGLSEVPPEDVWALAQLMQIGRKATQIKETEEYSQAGVIDKIQLILKTVNGYWEENAEFLNKTFYTQWRKWFEEAERRGKYPAGGWMASCQQYSQLVETLKVLQEEGIFDENGQSLEIGTASGTHTEQLTNGLARAGAQTELRLIDLCAPPLKDSSGLALGVQGSGLELPFSNGAFSSVYAHFTDSFIPTREHYDAERLNHLMSIGLKRRMLSEVYRVLKSGHILCMTFGTDIHPRSLHTDHEARQLLCGAGFTSENTLIVPTTDPYDYDEEAGIHKEGNYFLVAMK